MIKQLKYNDIKTDKINCEYSYEITEDSIIEVSKDACLDFLEKNIIKYTKDEYLYLYEFCTIKCTEFMNIKERLKIKKYCNMSFEVSHHLDKITLGRSILETEEVSHYVILSKDINNYITQLRFCIATLANILNISKEDKNE